MTGRFLPSHYRRFLPSTSKRASPGRCVQRCNRTQGTISTPAQQRIFLVSAVMPSARQRRKKRRAQEREAAAAMTEPPSLTCSHASALAPADSLANPTLSPCPLSTPIEIARRQKRNHEDDVDKEPVQQKLKTNKLDAADNRLIEDAKKKSTADTLAAYKKWEEQIRHHTGSVILKKIRQRFPPDGEEREIWERRIRQEDEEHLMFVYKAFIRCVIFPSARYAMKVTNK